jgi:hypothetical protein
MHRLIRSKQTKAFLKPDFTWTLDICKAMHLAELLVPEALRERCRSFDIEMYYSFDDDRETKWDFALPLA